MRRAFSTLARPFMSSQQSIDLLHYADKTVIRIEPFFYNPKLLPHIHTNLCETTGALTIEMSREPPRVSAAERSEASKGPPLGSAQDDMKTRVASQEMS